MNKVKSPHMQHSPDGAGLISRADAIEAVENNSYGMGSRASVKAIKALPSAELPNGDLISRADAIDAVAKAKATDPFGRYDKQNIGIDWALEALKTLPSAEATCATCADRAMCIMSAPDGNWKSCKDYRAEAVHGEWIRKEKEINDCDGHRAFYWYECDQCGTKPPKDTWGHEWNSNFCPNCGAKMTKGGDDE